MQEIVSLKAEWAPCAASSDLLWHHLLSDQLPCPAGKWTTREGNEPCLGGILEVRTQWHHPSLTAATCTGDQHIKRAGTGISPSQYTVWEALYHRYSDTDHRITPADCTGTGSEVMHGTEPEEWQERSLHVLHPPGLHPEEKRQAERQKDTFLFFRVCLKVSSLFSKQNRANPSIWESEQRQQSQIKHFPLSTF